MDPVSAALPQNLRRIFVATLVNRNDRIQLKQPLPCSVHCCISWRKRNRIEVVVSEAWCLLIPIYQLASHRIHGICKRRMGTLSTNESSELVTTDQSQVWKQSNQRALDLWREEPSQIYTSIQTFERVSTIPTSTFINIPLKVKC